MSAPTNINIGSCETEFQGNLREIKTWKPENTCEEYLKKWKDCKSFLGQFHHYYVYGEKQDCQTLKMGHERRIMWEQTHSPEAKEKLEELQHQEHVKRTRYPPLWEPRTQPPENWNSTHKNSSTDASNIIS